ncbi:hypothetical protein CPB83DRAFT_852491 [Crepidotus variabilis]|uniref:Uncharacterized protein n=1 Tax=Crepidotus variabilis TaxID=179855 RepID=A0A9P6EHB5_9AGAR|nr:hypothetical protein CPB83DRAFT_852491 [Crepidotus variabilis]
MDGCRLRQRLQLMAHQGCRISSNVTHMNSRATSEMPKVVTRSLLYPWLVGTSRHEM